jgi:DNA-binding IclR family transcriptional regulator
MVNSSQEDSQPFGDDELQKILETGSDGSALIARTLALLYLSSQKSGSNTRDLAKAAGIPLATTYRILRQLQDAGFVIEKDGAIHASAWIADSGDGSNEHLVIFAAPFLRQLMLKTGMTALLTARVNTLVLTLDAVHAKQLGSPVFRVGETRPLHAASSATPLLAFSSQELIQRIVNGPLKKYTANTPDVEQLREKLRTVKQNGYDYTISEVQPGWSGVGVPVFYGHEAIACLSLVAPTHRMPKNIESIASLLKQTSHGLSARLAAANNRLFWTPDNPKDFTDDQS